jgi:hypothetical protein
MWMNEYEIDEAAARFSRHPVLGPATRFLKAFKDEVNRHSDGWPYWSLPSTSAKSLMTLVYRQMMAGMGAYPNVPAPTMDEVRKTLRPIKAFYTRRGYPVGMLLPPLSEVENAPSRGQAARQEAIA